MKNKHVFFIRADNDLDHITPIIYFLITKGQEVLIYLRNPWKDLKKDLRIQYLVDMADSNGVKICIIDVPLFSKALQKKTFLLYFSISRYLNKLNGKITNPIILKIISFIYNIVIARSISLRKRVENTVDLKKIFSEINIIRTFSCDYSFDNFIKKNIDFCCANGIKTIALPHSINHIKSLRMGNSFSISINEHPSNMDYLNYFDSILTTNYITRNRLIKNNIKKDKIIVSGSLRFSIEWIDILRKIFINIKDDESFVESKINIVFILSKFIGHVDKKEVYRIIKAINEDDRFNLIIIPHSRIGYSEIPKSVVKSSKFSKCCIPTFFYSDKADLIIFWGTSFIYDPLILNKAIINLRYPFYLDCDFSDYITTWEAYNRDSFSDILNSFNKKKNIYSEDERIRCINNIVIPSGIDPHNIINKVYEI